MSALVLLRVLVKQPWLTLVQFVYLCSGWFHFKSLWKWLIMQYFGIHCASELHGYNFFPPRVHVLCFDLNYAQCGLLLPSRRWKTGKSVVNGAGRGGGGQCLKKTLQTEINYFFNRDIAAVF